LKIPRGQGYRTAEVEEDLVKILKANAYLLLYNLVESSIRAGLIEIYDTIHAAGLSFDDLTSELQIVLLQDLFPPDVAQVEGIAQRVHEFVRQTVKEEAVQFDPQKIKFAGNVDARKVRHICEEYGFSSKTRNIRGGDRLVEVKRERNYLAHGLKSFVESGRDVTYQDLDQIKRQVVSYVRQILNNIQRFINAKRYAV
ncbi:MAG: hypothetical protein JOZ44_02390, partial [Acidobacteria bacterium]|nr:hypothetical protein [Acidobacteriota bacterium]